MLHVTSELYARAASGSTPDLKVALQAAIELEHATMPPYLFALYSLGGSNADIARVLREIVREEMLHMLLAGNLLKAIGGHPVINSKAFVPTYPSHLPGCVATGLIVPLERFSLKLAEDKFMAIEQPEKPLPIPVRRAVSAGLEPARTIGEFYRRIRDIFKAPGADTLITVQEGQPTVDDFPENQKITTAAQAVAAINVIIDQGEGTETDPHFPGSDNLPENDELAHYYRFAELVRGRIKKNPNPPPKPEPKDLYFYDANDRVPFTAAEVLPVRANPRASDFADKTPERLAVDKFNRMYTQMLGLLDDAFNRDPAKIIDAINLMKPGLRNAAKAVMAIVLDDGTRPGPSFEFLV